MIKRVSLKMGLLNFLGGAGYAAALLQWFWAFAIFLPSIVAVPFVKEFLGHPETETIQPSVAMQASPAGSNPFVTFLGVALAVAVVVGIVYVLIAKIPRSIAASGEVITHKPAAVIAPIVVKHIHLSPKEKRALPTWLILVFKLLLVFVPLWALAFASSLDLAISLGIIITVGLILFSWSFLLFSIQFLLVKLWKVDYEKVR